MYEPPFAVGMSTVGYGPALRLVPSTLSCLVGGRVEGLFCLKSECLCENIHMLVQVLGHLIGKADG